jgi:hypothetical protein
MSMPPTFSLSLLKTDLVDVELIFLASNDDADVDSLADRPAPTALAVELAADRLRADSMKQIYKLVKKGLFVIEAVKKIVGSRCDK